MYTIRRIIAAAVLMVLSFPALYAQQLSGKVTDANSGEPLAAAVVQIEGTSLNSVTNLDGEYVIGKVKAGKVNILVSYLGYLDKRLEGVDIPREGAVVDIALTPDEQALKGVVVTGEQRTNTVNAALQQVKHSETIVNNISAQEISLTQDSNAGEVIRRIPGVSLIDNRYVMVRGLSQRYNNVWMNGGAVASSEADSRAFSFDIIPSGQVDNLTIVKAPLSEYPADYSGGFILINTKEIASENTFGLQLGGNWNTQSVFKDFHQNRRSMGNWHTKDLTPLGDLKASADMTRSWDLGGRKLGLIATANYTSEYRTYLGMENNLFGVYNVADDAPNYLRHSVDDQYNHNQRFGALMNMTLLSRDGNNKYQFKNILNYLTNNRYTWRDGISAQSDLERSAEYYYRSRLTYNTQLTGKHTFDRDKLDWNLGYAYSNRNQPDRKRYRISDEQEIQRGTYSLVTGNDISMETTELDEHIFSANANNDYTFDFKGWEPELKFGAYGEYRTREYTTDERIFQWNPSSNNLPKDFVHMDIVELLSNPDNYGDDKFYILSLSKWRNNYRASNLLGAGFVSMTLPMGPWTVYAGLRFEHNDMTLWSNTSDQMKSEESRHYKDDDLFPSFNATYEINEKNQVRFAYGRTVNRPEFRERSGSVYYDFDLASDVQGNSELQSCYVQNVDLRYEWYPSRGEMISLAAFYKDFDHPIEWTYTVAGGTDLIYGFKNAKEAYSYGLELEVRKDLGFMGLRNFSLSLNGSLIKSEVKFEKGSFEKDRPMQGQSPYLVNAGLFYKNDKHDFQIALLYNRIGKRLIGVGRSLGSSEDVANNRVPDSYEMPRNVLDFSVSKQFGEHIEAKLYVRDILAENVYYKQFADVVYKDGHSDTIEEISRSFKPGQNIGVSIKYKF